jgi:molybdenum cofactor cytidylyltransferase
MSDPTIAAVVLAAGQSKRMLGANKLLLEVDGVAVVRRVVEAVLSGVGGPVVVVVGHEADRVATALEGLPVRPVLNPSFVEGMGTSVAAGVASVRPGPTGYLICVGDLPGLSPILVRTVVDAFRRADGSQIVAPSHRGRRGHPVIFPARYRPDLIALQGDKGGARILDGADVGEVEVDDRAIFRDVDTPSDYEAFESG